MGRSLADYLHTLIPRASAPTWLLVTATAFILVATPFAAFKFQKQAAGYQPRDAGALTAIVGWLDEELPTGNAVLTEVRDGKWLEGMSGRAALFSLPVRYSFRHAEWERGMAATTLLQSVGAVANQFYFAKFADGDPCSSADPPDSFTLGVNHGGEFVDTLKVSSGQVRILSTDVAGGILATVASLGPESMTTTLADGRLTLRASWSGGQPESGITFVQTTYLTDQSATVELRGEVKTVVPVTGLELDLLPVRGMAITSVAASGAVADVHFTQMGLSQPHLRVVVASEGGSIAWTDGGALRVRTTSSQLRLLITDLSASDHFSSDLGLLCANQLRDAYRIGAVILAQDASFTTRQQRIQRLGFHLAAYVGPYAVMLRDTGVAQQGLRASP